MFAEKIRGTTPAAKRSSGLSNFVASVPLELAGYFTPQAFDPLHSLFDHDRQFSPGTTEVGSADGDETALAVLALVADDAH